MILYTPGFPPKFTDADALPKPGVKKMTVESTTQTVATDVAADIAALKARVSALETDAEAAYVKAKALAAKAVAFAKTGGGAAALLGAGYAASKFGVVEFVLKHVL